MSTWELFSLLGRPVYPLSHPVQFLFPFTLCLTPSHTLSGWPASACTALVPGSSLPSVAALGTSRARSESKLPSHQPPCLAMRRPDSCPWPVLGNCKDRIHDVPTLGLLLSNLLTSHVPEIIRLVLGQIPLPSFPALQRLGMPPNLLVSCVSVRPCPGRGGDSECTLGTHFP